jgi:ATP-dependent protease ClpP protease subunit
MYLALKCDPLHVTIRIPRLAASAASIIACAGDRIEIAEAAGFEIHDSRISCAYILAGLFVPGVSRT